MKSEDEIYKSACLEWIEKSKELKKLEAEVLDLRESVIALAGGNRQEYGVKVSKSVYKGMIDYKLAMKGLGIPEEKLETFRGDKRTIWKVVQY